MAETEYLTVPHLNMRYLRMFFRRIEFTASACWEWRGRVTSGDYGRVRYNGRSELTHRLMYAWLVAPIPRGVGTNIPQVDHFLCSNPSCCNPTHMKLVSNRENALRSRPNPIVRNAAKTHCPEGHPLGNRPLDLKTPRRYCVQCSRMASSIKRADPDYPERMRAYLRQYYLRRLYGPERERLLESARAAQRRSYWKNKMKGIIH